MNFTRGQQAQQGEQEQGEQNEQARSGREGRRQEARGQDGGHPEGARLQAGVQERRDGVDRVAVKYAYAFAAQTVVGEIPEIPETIISSLYSEGSILDYSEDAEFSADWCVQ